VFQRNRTWWIRWVCTLGHDHRNLSGALKTVATEEHKAKRAEGPRGSEGREENIALAWSSASAPRSSRTSWRLHAVQRAEQALS